VLKGQLYLWLTLKVHFSRRLSTISSKSRLFYFVSLGDPFCGGKIYCALLGSCELSLSILASLCPNPRT
jgi:hypothetical protein